MVYEAFLARRATWEAGNLADHLARQMMPAQPRTVVHHVFRPEGQASVTFGLMPNRNPSSPEFFVQPYDDRGMAQGSAITGSPDFLKSLIGYAQTAQRDQSTVLEPREDNPLGNRTLVVKVEDGLVVVSFQRNGDSFDSPTVLRDEELGVVKRFLDDPKQMLEPLSRLTPDLVDST